MAYFPTRSGGIATPPCAFASDRAYPVVSWTGRGSAAGRSLHKVRHGCRPYPPFDQVQDRPVPSRARVPSTTVYRPRRPEKTVVYQLRPGALGGWLARVREAEPDGDPIPRFIERDCASKVTSSAGSWPTASPARIVGIADTMP